MQYTLLIKAKIHAYDPIVEKSKILNQNLLSINSIEEAFKNKDLIVIANDNSFFSNLKLNQLSKFMKKESFIYDVWNLYDKKNLKLNNDVKYFSLGSQNIIENE